MSKMPEKTPLELCLVEALKSRREAEALEAKAAEATNPQWRLYYAREAANARVVEQYDLGRAWEHAALFLDGEEAAQ